MNELGHVTGPEDLTVDILIGVSEKLVILVTYTGHFRAKENRKEKEHVRN